MRIELQWSHVLHGNGFVGDHGSYRACIMAESTWAAVVNHGEIERGHGNQWFLQLQFNLVYSIFLLVHALQSYGSCSACLSVNALLHNSFASLRHGVVRYFTVFQMHILGGFYWKRFILQFWRHLLTIHHRSVLPCTLAAFQWTEWNSRLLSRYKYVLL